jgi:hypothetical protein
VILAGFSANISLIVGRYPAIAASKKGLLVSTLAVSRWICEKRAGIRSVGLFEDAQEGRTDAGNEDAERKWQRGFAGGTSR